MVGKAHVVAADQVGALRHLGHLEMRLGQPVAEVALEDRDEQRVAHELDAHRARHALDGDVVVGRPDAARGEDHVVVAAERGDLAGDQLDLVGDDRDAAHVDAERAQLAAEVGGVGVGDLAGEDLVADEDDSGGLRHGSRRFYE